MKSILFILPAFILFSYNLYPYNYPLKKLSYKILPKWQKNPVYPNLKNFVSSNPPQGQLYVPAEYARMDAVLIQPGLFDTESIEYYKKMVKALYDSGATPYILIGSDTEKYNIISKLLRPNKIKTEEVVFLNFDYDSVWARDYGPWDTYLDGSRITIDMKYYSDRTNDDAVPVKLAKMLNEDLYKSPLYTEGGNFMTDGKGSCWVSQGVIEFNTSYNNMTVQQIKNIYYDYLGCNTLTIVPPIPQEGTTHIDMFSKVVNQNTILVGYSKPEWGATQEEIEHLDNVASIYENSPKPDGGKWNILRIPMTFANYSDPDWGDYRVYYTHTNALLVNNYALIPFYNRSTDQEAYRVYKKALPEYTIIGIDSNAFIPYGGAIHCTTMQIPVKSQPECGNGVIEGNEVCENNYLNGHKCDEVEDFSGGKLKCNECNLDYSECILKEEAPLNDNQKGVCKGSKKSYSYEKLKWVEDYSKIQNYEETETLCDGLDNNCDGIVDNIDNPPLNINQKGVCKGSTKICTPEGWKESYENIKNYSVNDNNNDGLDNNCDGQTDESYIDDGCNFSRSNTKNMFFVFLFLITILIFRKSKKFQ